MVQHPDQAPFANPLPPDVLVDRSGGLRARVSDHAIRRYCERVLGLGEDRLAGIDDHAAQRVLVELGFDVEAVRIKLAYHGGVALRHLRAPVVRVAGMVIRVSPNGVVITVVGNDAAVAKRRRKSRFKQLERDDA